MAAKRRASSKDRLAAHLVLVVVFGMVFIGAIALYMTGLFDPAEGEPMLADTKPLDLATQPPRTEGLASWLFASAYAEEEQMPTLEPDVAPESRTTGASAAAGADLDALLAEILEEEAESVITEADIVKIDENDLSINENLPDNWVNVLLMATDGRDRNAKNGRTDVMIIASINETTGEIKLSSLARDLYVQIPGSSYSNRINTAYAYGGGGKSGAKVALKTINQLFEMNIQYYVVVNFVDMVNIVDAIGGVDIQLVGDEYKYINENVAVSEDYEGFAKSSARRAITADQADSVVHLDGLQALGYARIRKLDNDLQRGSRQRILLKAILDKATSNLSYSSIVSLANSLIPNTDTNFPIPTEGMRIGVAMMWADSISMTELGIPIEKSYHYTRVQDRNGLEMDVVSFNQQDNTKALHEFIYGEYIPAAAPQ